MENKNYGSFEELVNLKSGSRRVNYFSIKNGEEARVRFMYDKLEEMHFFWVHKLNNPYATIACSNQSKDDNNSCKWCDEGIKREAKIILPVYNEDKEEIQYWERTVSYAQSTVIPILREIADINQPIASQVYKIKRTGEGMQTTYTIIPTGQPDGQTKNNFGEVLDEYDSGLIKGSDFDYDTYKIERAGKDGSYNNFTNNTPQPTRRTTVFD